MRLKKTLSSPVANSDYNETSQMHILARKFARSDMCPSCLKGLSEDDTISRWMLKKHITLSSRAAKADTRLHMHAFSQELFVGPELFSKVISRRHLYS